ncbi:coniferyl aldehyde dehydrogenase [Agarilytica rhodophyticola]|uniref:coniferyl aldehyde dehydrogenase n=1 Tax=Agarilytica rhodophyticola TaxID=1737490 RepID=UPI000B349445|nr:coniferyl aldehyde dehydrogenase [Agarilytica rhodophyticola]
MGHSQIIGGDLLDIALQRQQKYFAQNRYLEASARKQNLRQLLKLVVDNRDSICAALTKDFGCRDKQESLLIEVFPCQELIKHSIRHLSAWMKPKRKSVSLWFQPGRAKVMSQPLGTIGVITPWNYPLFLAIGPVAGALSAGNTTMVKMPEHTPVFSQLFADLVKEYFDPELLTVVNGDVEVGKAFTALPFDHLLFTGATQIGKHVMRTASENLTPVTLELGGKSPVIIGESFPSDAAIKSIINGKLINSGQTCIAPDYILLPQNEINTFTEQARKTAQQFYPDWQSRGYTSIISENHYQRLNNMLEDAKSKGAKLVPLFEGGSISEMKKIVPTIIIDATDDMAVLKEEIFGPLLPLVGYESFESGIEYINQRPKPLALYLFSHNKKEKDKILKNTLSGGVTINDTILHIAQDNLPFGGVGTSGMGHYHGEAGFRTFSKEKSIFIQSRFNGIPFLYPPYNKGIASWLLKFMLGPGK